MNCVSLFSGCGGLDLGLKEAGFKVLLANDIWPLCKDTHDHNFPGTDFVVGSVSLLTKKTLREHLGDKMTKIDLLVGGPPCPPFSKSRFYRTDKPRAMDDPVGQETISGYLNVLRDLRPRAFLIENVFGMAYKAHSETLEHIVNTAERLGYSVSHRVLNAADYGVPQIRERFFMVGMLGKAFDFPRPTHQKPKGSQNKSTSDDHNEASDRLPWVATGAVLNDLDTDTNADDTGHKAGGKDYELLKQVPPGDNYLFFTKERGHPKPQFLWRKRYWSFLLKLSPDMPSWTIQARRSNNMGPFHWRNRILRIEEIKRIQTFPDSFLLAGDVEDQWRQIGNAVPPLMGKVLGLAISRQLKGVKRANS